MACRGMRGAVRATLSAVSHTPFGRLCWRPSSSISMREHSWRTFFEELFDEESMLIGTLVDNVDVVLDEQGWPVRSYTTGELTMRDVAVGVEKRPEFCTFR